MGFTPALRFLFMLIGLILFFLRRRRRLLLVSLNVGKILIINVILTQYYTIVYLDYSLHHISKTNIAVGGLLIFY